MEKLKTQAKQKQTKKHENHIKFVYSKNNQRLNVKTKNSQVVLNESYLLCNWIFRFTIIRICKFLLQLYIHTES